MNNSTERNIKYVIINRVIAAIFILVCHFPLVFYFVDETFMGTASSGWMVILAYLATVYCVYVYISRKFTWLRLMLTELLLFGLPVYVFVWSIITHATESLRAGEVFFWLIELIALGFFLHVNITVIEKKAYLNELNAQFTGRQLRMPKIKWTVVLIIMVVVTVVAGLAYKVSMDKVEEISAERMPQNYKFDITYYWGWQAAVPPSNGHIAGTYTADGYNFDIEKEWDINEPEPSESDLNPDTERDIKMAEIAIPKRYILPENIKDGTYKHYERQKFYSGKFDCVYEITVKDGVISHIKGTHKYNKHPWLIDMHTFVTF